MEAAGLALGAFPIAIWCLEQYAEPFEVYTRYSDAINSVIMHLRVQKENLEGTIMTIGLDLKALTREELESCLQTRFPAKQENILFLFGEMESAMASLLGTLQVDMNYKPTWTDEPPERVSWEWRKIKNSLSSKKRDKLLNDLRAWNRDLKDLVEHAQGQSQAPADTDEGPVRRATAMFDPMKCEAARRSAVSLHDAVRHGIGCTASHVASIDLDWRYGAVSDSQSFGVGWHCPDDLEDHGHEWNRFHASSHIKSGTKTQSQQTLLLPPNPLPARSPSPTASFRSFSQKLGLSRKSSQMSQSSDTSSQLNGARLASSHTISVSKVTTVSAKLLGTTAEDSSEIVVRNLCAEFHKPLELEKNKPFGLLKSPSQRGQTPHFSLVHASMKRQPVEPISLRKVIGSVDGDKYTPLSRVQRHAVAASLASMVLHLSGSPWLGERWSEEQVKIFLERDASGREGLSENPCLSYNFDTDSDAQKPNSAHSSLSERIILALGIILVELGVNQAFEAGGIGELLDGNTITLKQKLQKNLDTLYLEHGEWYAYAAQRCVYGEFQGQTSQRSLDVAKFRQQFHDAVVAPLQATYEMSAKAFSF